MTKLSSKYKTGEIAEALVKEFFHTENMSEPRPLLASKLIIHLTNNNFVIAPRPYSRPARRGKNIGNTKPKPYTGPAMIGKSHSARLAGQ